MRNLLRRIVGRLLPARVFVVNEEYWTPDEIDRHDPWAGLDRDNPIIEMTDTTITIVDPARWAPDQQPASLLLDWGREHGIDPGDILALGSYVRDPKANTIAYVGWVRDSEGRRRLAYDGSGYLKQPVVVHLDRPPAPWPSELERLAGR